MRPPFEPPQKGNPHSLPINQHVFPKRSIERFANSSGRVAIFDKRRGKVRSAKPSDDVFLAKRRWDRRAERGYMKSIEDDFQKLAEEIIAGATGEIDASRKGVIDHFFALWRVRAEHESFNVSSEPFKGVTGNNWTRDEEERFEDAGVLFLRADGTMPQHRQRGVLMQVAIDGYLPSLAQVHWSIVRAREGQFVVPDHPIATIIPLTPSLCICQGEESGLISNENVAQINGVFRGTSRAYFFGRDLAQCP